MLLRSLSEYNLGVIRSLVSRSNLSADVLKDLPQKGGEDWQCPPEASDILKNQLASDIQNLEDLHAEMEKQTVTGTLNLEIFGTRVR